MTDNVIALIVSMVFSAFFSGMEIAFVSSNRMLAEMERGKNGIQQRAIALFYRHPNNFVSTMLVGNNIALVIYGILFAQIFDATLFASLGDGERVTADTIASTVVVLFTGEFIPKLIFKSNPNTMLSFFAIPALVCYILLYPISRFATLLSKWMLALVGVKMQKAKDDIEFGKVDLDYLVQSSIDNAQSDDEIEEEVKIFHNVLDFSETRVKDCMVPRTEIEGVNIDESGVEELKNQFIETGFSKLVVYKGDIDHVVGYIHSSEMFRSAATWRDNIRTMPFVPETMAAKKLMQTFLQQKKSLAIVVDEFGGTSGLVSLEDIVEEIFGDIEDEHDSNNYIARRTDDGEYLLSARLEIEKANEMLDLDLPENDDYMTVGGLILHEYQSFPKLNEIVKIGKLEFKIIKSTMTKIELVKLKITE
ncbi:MAG: hemolysin family protein [Prevotella sp.]|uniref:hemolysin family protein n=1 Tax=Prevotella sp. P5-92 TaxID=2024222 RepID=UPI000B973BE8|nr:hemolysin family protein [Prevotella sp. P5-92]MCI7400371.1 hemolysin family protein [Prevotella sp.]MDD6820237.1 hemolysin family protein [Prevotella sp.]MDY4653296.1 hemolysin family protein [Prevotella sp.]OYP57741.1 hemolysin [Prevotella sp. P5-92]